MAVARARRVVAVVAAVTWPGRGQGDGGRDVAVVTTVCAVVAAAARTWW